MITSSAPEQENETSHGIGGDMVILSNQAVSNEKSKEGEFEVKTEEVSSTSCEEIEVLFDKQSEVERVYTVNAMETALIVNEEDKQSQSFYPPIYNIHIHVSPSSGDSSSVPATVQPIIHLHFDENSKNRESVSSQKSMIERRVQCYLSMTSTDSKNMSTDYSDSSDIVKKIKEYNCSSPNENGVKEKNDADVDKSDLSDISDSEISTDWQTKKDTQNQVPVSEVANLEESTSQKQCVDNSDKSEQDKDFESVYPKLQEKVDNLIKENLQSINTHSYNKVKEKINGAEYKNSDSEDDRTSPQLRSNRSNEPKKLEDPVLMEDTEEVIVLSDSDSPAEMSDKEEIIEEKKQEKRKSNLKSTKTLEDADSSEDERGRYRLRKRNVEPKKQEIVKTRETRESRDRKCKKPSKEQHLNWVKKVAFAKAFDLQPTVFAEKEILVKSPVKPKKDQNLTSRSLTPLASVIRKERIERNNGIVSCETPKRLSSYKHVKKRGSINDVESCPKALRSQNRRQRVKYRVSDSEDEIEKEKYISMKVQELRNKHNPSFTLANSNEETQENDSLVSCETPKRLSSYQHVNKNLSKEINNVESSSKALGSSNMNQGSKFQISDSEDERDEEICNTKKARELRNKPKTSLVSVNSNEETQQKESLASCETSKKLSYGYQALPSGFADDSNKAQELENDSETSMMSVVSNEEIEQNDIVDSCETPKRLSNASHFQPAEKEILEKSPVNSKTAQELKSIWQTAFASVDKKKEPQQNGSQTSKRLSSQSPQQSFSREDVLESSPKELGSPNDKEGGKDEVSASENKRNEEICTSAPTPIEEENLESVNNKRYMTLLAEGCNFSEILQKFREKHYKDKVKVFFPDKIESNNNHIPENSNCSANNSAFEDEPTNKSPPGEVSDVSTVKQKKEKEKSDELNNEDKADENSNTFLPVMEPAMCSSSSTTQPFQRTHTSASPHGKESLNETIHVSDTFHSDEIHFNNEKNVNDDGNVPGNKNFEKISGGNTVDESYNNSSSTGNGTTPEKNILQKGNHESNDEYINEFRAIKKKLRSLPNNNNLSKPDLEINNDIQSKASLENLRKDLFIKCMAQQSSDIKQPEKTDPKVITKRRGSPEPSNLDKSSSSSKKMKESKKKNANSNKGGTRGKGFTDEDYIPLKASGPTKFAVAPLDKVTPYREHEAKDFKANTLYGKRVSRFNSPKSLEINKSKQKARKKAYY